MPLPTGGTTSAPIKLSAATIAAEIVPAGTPFATLSLAEINWWAREISPFPATGWLNIEISCVFVYETVPSSSELTGQLPV